MLEAEGEEGDARLPAAAREQARGQMEAERRRIQARMASLEQKAIDLEDDLDAKREDILALEELVDQQLGLR